MHAGPSHGRLAPLSNPNRSGYSRELLIQILGQEGQQRVLGIADCIIRKEETFWRIIRVHLSIARLDATKATHPIQLRGFRAVPRSARRLRAPAARRGRVYSW